MLRTKKLSPPPPSNSHCIFLSESSKTTICIIPSSPLFLDPLLSLHIITSWCDWIFLCTLYTHKLPKLKRLGWLYGLLVYMSFIYYLLFSLMQEITWTLIHNWTLPSLKIVTAEKLLKTTIIYNWPSATNHLYCVTFLLHIWYQVSQVSRNLSSQTLLINPKYPCVLPETITNHPLPYTLVLIHTTKKLSFSLFLWRIICKVFSVLEMLRKWKLTQWCWVIILSTVSLFAHRWLQKYSATKEPISKPLGPADSPFPLVSRKKNLMLLILMLLTIWLF